MSPDDLLLVLRWLRDHNSILTALLTLLTGLILGYFVHVLTSRRERSKLLADARRDRERLEAETERERSRLLAASASTFYPDRKEAFGDFLAKTDEMSAIVKRHRDAQHNDLKKDRYYDKTVALKDIAKKCQEARGLISRRISLFAPDLTKACQMYVEGFDALRTFTNSMFDVPWEPENLGDLGVFLDQRAAQIRDLFSTLLRGEPVDPPQHPFPKPILAGGRDVEWVWLTQGEEVQGAWVPVFSDADKELLLQGDLPEDLKPTGWTKAG